MNCFDSFFQWLSAIVLYLRLRLTCPSTDVDPEELPVEERSVIFLPHPSIRQLSERCCNFFPPRVHVPTSFSQHAAATHETLLPLYQTDSSPSVVSNVSPQLPRPYLPAYSSPQSSVVMSLETPCSTFDETRLLSPLEALATTTSILGSSLPSLHEKAALTPIIAAFGASSSDDSMSFYSQSSQSSFADYVAELSDSYDNIENLLNANLKFTAPVETPIQEPQRHQMDLSEAIGSPALTHIHDGAIFGYAAQQKIRNSLDELVQKNYVVSSHSLKSLVTIPDAVEEDIAIALPVISPCTATMVPIVTDYANKHLHTYAARTVFSREQKPRHQGRPLSLVLEEDSVVVDEVATEYCSSKGPFAAASPCEAVAPITLVPAPHDEPKTPKNIFSWVDFAASPSISPGSEYSTITSGDNTEPCTPLTEHGDFGSPSNASSSGGSKTISHHEDDYATSSRRVSLYGGVPRTRYSDSAALWVSTLGSARALELEAARKQADNVARFRASFAYTRPDSSRRASGLRPLVLPTRLAQRETAPSVA